jgi:hypothetical protein
MSATSEDNFDRIRLSVGCLLAVTIGFLSQYFLAVAWGALSYVIDPTARLAAFLLRPPHHPVRLEVASLVLPAMLGALTGVGLSFLIRWRKDSNYWLVWLVFAGSFIVSTLIIMPGIDSWSTIGLIRTSVFLCMSAAACHRLPAGELSSLSRS